MVKIIDDEEEKKMHCKGRGWRYIQANFCIPAIWSDDLLPATHIAARSYSGQMRIHHEKDNDVKMLSILSGLPHVPTLKLAA